MVNVGEMASIRVRGGKYVFVSCNDGASWKFGRLDSDIEAIALRAEDGSFEWSDWASDEGLRYSIDPGSVEIIDTEMQGDELATWIHRAGIVMFA